jgi:nitrogen fixation NifU-like protein
MSLESLYQEIILDHYRHPRNFGEIEGASISTEHENPICGDHLNLQVHIENGHIQNIRFGGGGCAIFTASTSMMTEAVKGQTLEETEALIDKFLRLMRGEEPEGVEELGDLEALRGVVQFPVRVKCATLGWHALEAGLAEYRAGDE